MLNDLNLRGNSIAEIDIQEFTLTVPDRLKHRISVIMESGDISSISLGILYGVLKTYELDLQQRKLGFGKVITVSSSVVLVTKNQS